MLTQIHNPTPKEMKRLQKRRSIYLRQREGTHFKNGDPRYIAIYDNGGETTDRYTVVFTRKIDGRFFVLGMSEAPFWPQGVCLSSEYPYRVDKPSYKHLGKRIGFTDLPSGCQKAVMQDYIYLYDLVKGES